MENIVTLIIQFVSGGVGGLAAGKLGDEISLGTVWNIIAGIIGGVGFGQLLNFLDIGASMAGGFTVVGILSNIFISAIGGIAAMLFVVAIKHLFSMW